MNKNYRYSTNNLHKELDILKIKDLIQVETLTFMHDYTYNKLPKIFNNYFDLFGEVTNIITRGSYDQMIVDMHNTNMGKTTMKIT